MTKYRLNNILVFVFNENSQDFFKKKKQKNKSVWKTQPYMSVPLVLVALLLEYAYSANLPWLPKLKKKSFLKSL